MAIERALQHLRPNKAVRSVRDRKPTMPSDTSSDRTDTIEKLTTLIDRCASQSHSMKLARQEVVYSEGQLDRKIYLIEFGQVKAVTCSPTGRRCLLSIRTAGEFVGELGLLYSSRRETVSAMKPTRLRCIPVTEFRSALVAADLFDEFVLYLLRNISDQQASIANLVTMNSEQRLAATILELATKLGTERNGNIYLNDRITHEELSTMVGTTRSRVGFFLKKFRSIGIITTVGSSVVVNEESLRDYLWSSA